MGDGLELFWHILFNAEKIDNNSSDFDQALTTALTEPNVIKLTYEAISGLTEEDREKLIADLVVCYARFNANATDDMITFLANSSKKDIISIFSQDFPFARKLLISYIAYLKTRRYPAIQRNNLRDILFINIKYGLWQVKTLEEVLNDTLKKLVSLLSEVVNYYDLVVYLIASLFFGGRLTTVGINAEKEIDTIKAYQNYIIRMGYARLYALELGCNDFEFDANFLAKFDEHVYYRNFSLDSIKYGKEFFAAYLSGLDYNGELYLDDSSYDFVRSINPLYLQGRMP